MVMSDTAIDLSESVRQDEYVMSIDLMLSEMHNLNFIMRQDQEEIERLKRESLKLKTETALISLRTEKKIDSLWSKVMV